jgi:hypothetical protein
VRIPNGIAALLVLFAFAGSVDAIAQDENRVLIDLRVDQVQPGDEEEYIDIQESIAATLKAANRGPRDVWMEIGKTAGVFHVISPADELSAAHESHLPVIESSERMTLQLYPELTIPPSTGAPSEFLKLTYTVVARDSRDAYFSWIRDHLRPYLQSAGASGIVFTRVAAEGDTDTWIRASSSGHKADSVAARKFSSDLAESSRTIMLQHIPSASVEVD